MERRKPRKEVCKNCKHSRTTILPDGLCSACSRRAAHPDTGPDGRVLPPAVGKVCWGCGTRFATTHPDRTRCGDCERSGKIEVARAYHTESDMVPALVAWHAILQARGLPCETDPGGRFKWCLDWALAFPNNGAAGSDTARQRIREALDSVGRLDLMGPGRRKAR